MDASHADNCCWQAIAHREAKDWSDWVALTAVRFFRWSFDFATGYKHDKQVWLPQIPARLQRLGYCILTLYRLL